MNPYAMKTKDVRRRGMTAKDADVLIEYIRNSKFYDRVCVAMRPLENKVKAGMVLFKNESERLKSLYERISEYEMARSME